MTTNLIPCPMCGLLHEAVVVAGATLIPCPFQKEDEAVLISDAFAPRGVVVIDIGEEVGTNVCDLSH